MLDIIYKVPKFSMERYQQYTQGHAVAKKQPSSSLVFQEKSLKIALAISLIKSITGRLNIKSHAFGFKQIQIASIKLASTDSEAFLLQKRIKKCDESISEIHHSQIHKEKSMEILRNIKSSLEKKRIPHSQSARPLCQGLNTQRNKILDQITEKLEMKNRAPQLIVQKPNETLQLNKRVAKLQTLMQQIKKERQMTEKPAVVHEKQKLNRINVHMLEEKLAQERRKSESTGKQHEIITSIQEIKGQIKNIQKAHEGLLRNTQRQPFLSEKQPQASAQRPFEPIPQRRYEPPQVPVLIMKPQASSIQYQPKQEVLREGVQKSFQHIQPHYSQPIQAPVFNFYNVAPQGQSQIPSFLIPVNNSPYAKRPNTDRIVYQNPQFSNQQILRRPKFSLKAT